MSFLLSMAPSFLVLLSFLAFLPFYTSSTPTSTPSLSYSSIVGQAINISLPHGGVVGLVWDAAAGLLYYSTVTTASICAYSPTTQSTVSCFSSYDTTPSSLGEEALLLAEDPQGFLYGTYLGDVMTGVGTKILQFSKNGTLVAQFTNATSAPFHGAPIGVAVSPINGDIWVADEKNSRLVQLSATGAQLSVYTNVSIPAGVAFDSKGNLYVADSGNLRVLKRNSSGAFSIFYSDGQMPNQLTFDSMGNVYISEYSNQVAQVSPQGVLLNVFATASPAIANARAVAVDSVGNLYVADLENSQVVVFANAMAAAVQSTSAVPSAQSSSTATSGPSSYPSAQLCLISYGLPGTLDYPWSTASLLHFNYDPTPVTNAFGQAVSLLSGSGSRTFINRFGTATSTPFTLRTQSGPSYLYLNSATPVDQTGLTLTLANAIALPGVSSRLTQTSLRVFNLGGDVVEAFGLATELRIDGASQAYTSTLPGFVNTSVAASNLNSLSVNAAACQAPLTFTNGLRVFVQPASSNGAGKYAHSYSITDGALYSITTNLTLTASSGFATAADTLGNPYQPLVNIVGTRTYTYLPTGSSLTSTVSFNASLSLVGDQRFFPYSYINAIPGVYTPSTTPFVDGAGLQFFVSPAVPQVGQPLTSTALFSSVVVAVQGSESGVGLTESTVAASAATAVSPVTPPVYTLQQQRVVALN